MHLLNLLGLVVCIWKRYYKTVQKRILAPGWIGSCVGCGLSFQKEVPPWQPRRHLTGILAPLYGKCLVLAGFLSLSSPVPSMLCCEATSSFGLNCMQIGFTLWHCFAHFFRQAQRARWLQDGWKNIPKEKLSEAFTAETSLHSLLCQGSLLLHYLHFECP